MVLMQETNSTITIVNLVPSSDNRINMLWDYAEKQ
jgi:hypothetical protein